VACGTGVAARAAADRVGGSGAVVGVDLNPAMLEVATRMRPDLEWRQGDVSELPFRAASFDAVVCQSALFFFPDPDRALSEMARVVRPGGVVVIQTYAELKDQPAHQEFDAIVRRIAPGATLDLLDTYWSTGDLSGLTAALQRSGLLVVETRTTRGFVRYGTVENLVQTEIKGTPLVERLSQDQIEEILTESAAVLHPYVSAERGWRCRSRRTWSQPGVRRRPPRHDRLASRAQGGQREVQDRLAERLDRTAGGTRIRDQRHLHVGQPGQPEAAGQYAQVWRHPALGEDADADSGPGGRQHPVDLAGVAGDRHVRCADSSASRAAARLKLGAG
jgi:SAM-dependent methyltransferase